MTTISGTGEGSAVNTWLAGMIAKGQQAAEAAEAANPGSTTVKLSDGAKALSASNDWRLSSIEAIMEKANIELAQWDHAVRTAGTDDQNTLYAKFANAGEAEKEAYVQRKLIEFDRGWAIYAVSQKFSELVNYPISSDYSDAEIASMREHTELRARLDVFYYSKGPYVGTPSAAHGTTGTPSTVPPNEPGVAPKARVPNTEQSIAAAQRTRLEQLRQTMGAGTGAAADPEVQKYALPSAPGQASTAERLTVAQQRIDAVQAEFGALAEIWKKAAERGETWALPPIPNPLADNTGVNTFRYEESHEMYAPNIADLSLKVAKWSLGVVESAIGDPLYAGVHFHSRYGDQVISDYNDYVTAAKDHISKLESAATPSVVGAANGDSASSE